MKNMKMSVCVCVLAVMGLASMVFAQKRDTSVRMSMNDEAEARMRAKAADENAEATLSNTGKFKDKSVWQWLEESRQTFKIAEEKVAGDDDATELLVACKRMREAGLMFEFLRDSGNWVEYRELNALVSRIVYTSPFFPKEGQIDDQLKAQMLYVRAYGELVDVAKQYSKVASRCSFGTQIDVAAAIASARGKQHQADYYISRRNMKGGCMGFSRVFYRYLYFEIVAVPRVRGDSSPCPPGLGAIQMAKEIQRWQSLLDNLGNPNGKGAIQGCFPLLMRCGNPLGSHGDMPSREGFVFLARQAEQAWQTLQKQPPKEVLDYDYWARNPKPGKPALVLKVQVPRIMNCALSGQDVLLKWHLPLSFLRALARDQRTAEEAYATDFFRWRNEWSRISASEYARLKAEQQEWAVTNSDAEFAYEQSLCARFEALVPEYERSHTRDFSERPKFTKEALESAPAEPIALSAKAVAQK